MYIHTRHLVTDEERRRIGKALGLREPADRETIRAFLQEQGTQSLRALALPLDPAERRAEPAALPLEAR